MKNSLIQIILTLIIISCSGEKSGNKETMLYTAENEKTIRILYLGDSYTIGEAVNPEERWPVQLSDTLSGFGYKVEAPEIIATTGWTTAELIEGILAADPKGPYDLVSLLIGVNNQYRGQDTALFRSELKTLMQKALYCADKDPGRVIILSIPDYGVTPFAREKEPEKISHEIDLYNAICLEESERFGFRYVDVTPISRLAEADHSLLAEDGLHPSGDMYFQWVNQMIPVVLEMLRSRT